MVEKSKPAEGSIASMAYDLGLPVVVPDDHVKIEAAIKAGEFTEPVPAQPPAQVEELSTAVEEPKDASVAAVGGDDLPVDDVAPAAAVRPSPKFKKGARLLHKRNGCVVTVMSPYVDSGRHTGKAIVRVSYRGALWLCYEEELKEKGRSATTRKG